MSVNGRTSGGPGHLPATALLTTRAYLDLMRTASAACLRSGTSSSTSCAG